MPPGPVRFLDESPLVRFLEPDFPPAGLADGEELGFATDSAGDTLGPASATPGSLRRLP
jgi:hypothetical protein